MPSIARAKTKANQISCLNQMRQLTLAATLYVGDYNGELPPRWPRTNAWPVTLKPYYVNWQILACPSDHFGIVGLFANNAEPKRKLIFNFQFLRKAGTWPV